MTGRQTNRQTLQKLYTMPLRVWPETAWNTQAYKRSFLLVLSLVIALLQPRRYCVCVLLTLLSDAVSQSNAGFCLCSQDSIFLASPSISTNTTATTAAKRTDAVFLID